jgi:hypothetical protein
MESFNLFLNSFSGSPYITNRIAANHVIFTINWDAVFNLNNHKYRRCRLRHDYYSDAAPLANPFIPNAVNGVLVANGINSRSTSTTGGMVLGLITIDSIAVTNNLTAHPSATTSSNFVASIPSSTANLTISNTLSPDFMLAIGDSISFYDPNVVAYVSRTITAITGAYTYTLSSAIGATAITSSPMTCANPVTSSYTCLKSTTIQSSVGSEIEVPKGMVQLEVLLCNNNYGQPAQVSLLTGANIQDWALILNFEFYDPIPNEYTL